MFFLKEMTHTVTLPPEYFAANLNDLVRYALYRQLEGQCHGPCGYIVAIVSVEGVSAGIIRESSGGLLTCQHSLALAATASYEVAFKAVLYRPFKGEVCDAIIRTVNKMGFFGEIGPVQVFVSNHLLGEGWEFDGHSAFVRSNNNSDDSMTVRRQAGLTSHSFTANDIMAEEDEEEDIFGGFGRSLVAGAHVRVRIVGTRVDVAEIFAIGTMKEDHLGLLQSD